MYKPAIICFGQQPNGFFPKRFLVAKINTARALQKEIGGRIVFFYHDSDADYRETITVMKDRTTGEEVRLNFTQENKLQKKHSPLYAKRIAPSLNPSLKGGGKGVEGWKEEILKQLPRFLHPPLTPPLKGGEPAVIPSLARGEGIGWGLIDIFKSVNANTVANFCLEIYKKLGLLRGIEIVRSSDQDFRKRADNVRGGFADVTYKNEIVRAKIESDRLSLHEGGEVYTYLPKPDKLLKMQISPGADKRFKWMNSVINSTHYIYGEGEKDYLKFEDFPEVKFIQRDAIENPNYAYIPNP